MSPCRAPVLFLGFFLTSLYLTYGDARSHYNNGGVEDTNNPNNVNALKEVSSTSYDAVNRWMMTRRDLLNITIDTDKIDEEPLTASDLLLRAKLMAYVQKLVDKEAKKKAKEAKKTEKAKAKAALLGLPPGFWSPPPPVTVSPPFPIETSVNLTGSEPLPPTGFWLYKKAAFLTKLFSALADAAATLPGVTTEAPSADVDGADSTTVDDVDTETDDENTDDDGNNSIVNVNDKRSISSEEDDESSEYEYETYEEAPASRSHSRKWKHPAGQKHKHHANGKSQGRKQTHH